MCGTISKNKKHNKKIITPQRVREKLWLCFRECRLVQYVYVELVACRSRAHKCFYSTVVWMAADSKKDIHQENVFFKKKNSVDGMTLYHHKTKTFFGLKTCQTLFFFIAAATLHQVFLLRCDKRPVSYL